MTETATAGDRPVVSTLPELDTDAIKSAAAAWVADRLAGVADADAEQRAKAAAKIVTAEHRAAEKARIERDAAAYTIARDYTVRRGANIPGALGVNRNRWKVIRQRQQELIDRGEWIGPIFDAPKVLPGLALKAARHAERAAVAREVRYTATRELAKAGWTNKRIADLTGTDPSRVSHIKHSEGDAA